MSSSLLLFLNSLEERSIAISVSDPGLKDCPLIFVNRAFEQMTGYKRENVLGTNCRFLQGDDTDRNAVRKLRDQIAKDQRASATLTNYRADGSKFNNLIIIEPVFINADQKLLFGCQYEFDLHDNEGEIIDHIAVITRTLSENDSIIDQSRQVIARSMEARSQAIFTMVRNHASR